MKNIITRELPLVMQPVNGSSWICGASCLAMLFQSEAFASMNLPKEQNEIAQYVLAPRPNQPGQYYCDNLRMLNYVNQLGFPAAYVSVSDPVKSLKICQEKGLEAILLLRFNPKHGAHFVTFSSISKYGVFVNDPLRSTTTFDPQKENLNKKISLSELPKLMARVNAYDSEIIVPNSMLVISPPSINESYFIHECRDCGTKMKLPLVLKHQIKHILYPCDHGIYWVKI
ncbi:MAG: hypothetical protein CVV04_12115 [Firmicutes bacterium HGW-Firmicutes-9]|jgi:hypothetical protein|nr:MAG: hypothetical protein CVV04_12115 [Firmicutes bacterium HGW-Firmicutes-9]